MRLQGRVAALEAEVNTLHAACMEHIRVRNEMGERETAFAAEVESVLVQLDNLAHVWGDEGVFRSCRDRLRKALKEASPCETA